MTVDNLDEKTTSLAKQTILNLGDFLNRVQHEIEIVELTDAQKRRMNFSYHECWAFRERLLKMLDCADKFNSFPSHIYSQHRKDAEQDVKLLEQQHEEYLIGVETPEFLDDIIEKSEWILYNAPKKEAVLQQGQEVVLHLETDGTLWYIDRESQRCELNDAERLVLQHLTQKQDYSTVDELRQYVNSENVQVVRNRISDLRKDIKLNFRLTDVIENGKKGTGYRINPKYKIIEKN